MLRHSWLNGEIELTNADGEAHFGGLDPGSFTYMITKDEYLDLFVPTFSSKDTDHDKVLTATEFPYAASFKAGDVNQDNMLTEDEFKAMYSRQFDNRDANKDGVVTADEM